MSSFCRSICSVRPAIAATIGAAALAGSANAAPVEWTVASGGNGNFYERVEATNFTYTQARDAAAARSHNGLQGRLLVLENATYAAERGFVFNFVYSVGSPAEAIYWVGATRNNTIGNSRENWTWLTGEAASTSVTNGWNIDFFEGTAKSYAMGFFQNSSSTLWDYAQDNSTRRAGGYIVEYVIPAPASIGFLALGSLVVARRRR